MAHLLASHEIIVWRMLTVRWQQIPFNSGSHLTGQRLNKPGVNAIYFGLNHAVAIAEFHQSIVRPGTLVCYRIRSTSIVDFRDPASLTALDSIPEDVACDWKTLWGIEKRSPPSWTLADRAIEAGAEGALFPSFQHEGGTNLVLWRWHDAASAGEGAAVTLIDPMGDLHRA